MNIESVYVHIPFCNNICSYCDFPKMYYYKKWINNYLDSLKYEIETKYKKEIIKTIYIGGGTPTSLDNSELKKLLDILSVIKKDKTLEYTIECNLDSLTEEKIDLFKTYGINRLSIGIETFNQNHLKILNRKLGNLNLIKYAKKKGIENINVDLIYALPNQEIDELKEDLNNILKLDVKHISTYSLMIEPHTVLYNNKTEYIDQEKDYQMYNLICDTLLKKGYIHYEVSNFAKEGYESKHNLNYWNNKKYYGFGLGASGYIDNIRYTNTGSINEYLNKKYDYIKEELTKKEIMENEMILGLRKIKGVNTLEFYKKYGEKVEEFFDIHKLLEEGKLIKEDNYIYINDKYIYVSNEILINFIGV